MNLTDCTCTGPGWCERHVCQKSDTLFHLCQHNRALFMTWETGRGPGQRRSVTALPSHGPGLIQRGMNFIGAGYRHLANGLRKVDQTTTESRLAVCAGCPSCDLQRLVCLHVSCGCFLREKATWASETCPQGKWPAVPDPAGPVSPAANEPLPLC
jgi:hypothetical protein